MKKVISTNKAPAAIGTYSQAVVHQNTLYISGQIPLDPDSMEMVSDDIEASKQQELYPDHVSFALQTTALLLHQTPDFF